MKVANKTVKNIEILAVVGLIMVGAFLRLYRIRETLMFQGDQGRDALIVKEMIKDGNFTLLGPVTSVGNMYLGPFYYYFMAPFLMLTYPDPIGPAYGVALVNIGLLYLVYLVASKMFGKLTGIISLVIYTFMNPAILLSRFSWNPNLAPFFGLWLIWLLFSFWEKRRARDLCLIALCMGILSQLHYMTMVMVPVIALIYGLAFWQYPADRKRLIQSGLIAFGLYLVTFLPLAIFNQRHDNLIVNSFREFAKGKSDYFIPGNSLWNTFRETEAKSYRVFSQLVSSPNGMTDRLMFVIGLLGYALLIWKKKIRLQENKAIIIIFISLLATIVGISVYSGSIFDHYIGFIFPIVALYWGYLLAKLAEFGRIWGKITVLLILTAYIGLSLQKAPSFAKPGPTLDSFRRVAEDISAQIGQGKYNLTLLSDSKDYRGMNYRYFLGVSNRPPAGYDDYENLDELVVIDELDVPDPMQVKIFEIQHPQMKKLVNEFKVPNGPRIFIYQK